MAKLLYSLVLVLWVAVSSSVAFAADPICTAGSTNPPLGSEIVQTFVDRIQEFGVNGRFVHSEGILMRVNLETTILKLIDGKKVFRNQSAESRLYRALAIAANEGQLQKFMDNIILNQYGALRDLQKDNRYEELGTLSKEQQQRIAAQLLLKLDSLQSSDFAAGIENQKPEDKLTLNRATEILLSALEPFSLDFTYVIANVDVSLAHKLNWDQPGANIIRDLLVLLMSRADWKEKAAALEREFRTRRPGRSEEEKLAIAALQSINPVRAAFSPTLLDLPGATLPDSKATVDLMNATFEMLKTRYSDEDALDRAIISFGGQVGRNTRGLIVRNQPLHIVFRQALYTIHAEGLLVQFSDWLKTQGR